jgi:hypothetical protein
LGKKRLWKLLICRKGLFGIDLDNFPLIDIDICSQTLVRKLRPNLSRCILGPS